MLIPHVFHVEAIDRATLNRCLVAWSHRMGPYTRPSYAIEAHHALFMHGEPVAVTAAGDTPREVVGDTRLGRFEVVELARLCAAGSAWCQPMLRMWREALFPAIAEAHRRQFAVSYQDQRLHTGGIYRYDGWAMVGIGGGRWRRSALGSSRPGSCHLGLAAGHSLGSRRSPAGAGGMMPRRFPIACREQDNAPSPRPVAPEGLISIGTIVDRVLRDIDRSVREQQG